MGMEGISGEVLNFAVGVDSLELENIKNSYNNSGNLPGSSNIGTESSEKRLRTTETEIETENPIQKGVGQLEERIVRQHEIVANSEASNVFLSVCYKNKQLGAAYYDTNEKVIYVTQTSETDDFACLQLLKFQAKPSEIITRSSTNEVFVEALNQSVDGVGPLVRVVQKIDFDYEGACHRIQMLDLPDMPKNIQTEEKRLQYFHAYFNFEQEEMIRASGGLISFLLRTRATGELEDDEMPLCLNGVKLFSLSGTLRLDANATKSLQIFQSEMHPSVQGLGRSKEGLSLYSIYHDRAKSVVGRKLLKQWFMRPTMHIETLNDRLDTVEFFMKMPNADITKDVRSCLCHIKDVSIIINRIKSAKSTVHDFKHLYETAVNVGRIRDTLIGTATSIEQLPPLEIFAKVMEFFTPNINELATLLYSVLDLDLSVQQGRCVVARKVDPQLDRFKDVYDDMEEFLTNIAAEEISTIPPQSGITTLRYVYFPQIGYLVVVPCSEECEEGAKLLNFTYQFRTKEYIYYKSSRAYEMDEYFGDVHALIIDRENQIVRELENFILECASDVIRAVRICAELDCLMTYSMVAMDHNYTRPKLTEERVLHVKGGRHPLQELCVDTFIPNNIDMCQDGTGEITKDDTKVQLGRMVQVITGPNYSGKSIYAKQVATITFMAHLGSFVPATEATIGVTDQIFTRIHSRETASISQSTFMIDLIQVAIAFRHSTEQSLIIMDEFGKGTSNIEGMSLLVATLRQLMNRPQCPRVLCTTHFHEIIALERICPELSLSGDQVSFMSMKVLHHSSAETKKNVKNKEPDNNDTEALGIESENELVFLYKLIPGWSGRSFGAHCATAAGVPSEIVKRGAEVSHLLINSLPIGRLDATKAEDTLKKYTRIVEAFLALDLENDDVINFVENTLKSSSEEGTEVVEASVTQTET